jgi:hypothetical protein
MDLSCPDWAGWGGLMFPAIRLPDQPTRQTEIKQAKSNVFLFIYIS